MLMLVTGHCSASRNDSSGSEHREEIQIDNQDRFKILNGLYAPLPTNSCVAAELF